LFINGIILLVAMIGNDLQRQLDLEDRTVPLLVEKCIEAVEARGKSIMVVYYCQ
jgi:hypothetical protein